MKSTIHRGKLEISGDGAKNYQHITHIEGYLVTGPNAQIHLPNLKEVKAITLRNGASVTLPGCTYVEENINLDSMASISLPVIEKVDRLLLSSDTIVNLPKCTKVTHITMGKGASVWLPICHEVLTSVFVNDGYLELPECYRINSVTAQGKGTVILDKCTRVNGSVIADGHSYISLAKCQSIQMVGASENAVIDLPNCIPRQAPLTVNSKGKVNYKSAPKPAVAVIDYQALARSLQQANAAMF